MLPIPDSLGIADTDNSVKSRTNKQRFLFYGLFDNQKTLLSRRVFIIGCLIYHRD